MTISLYDASVPVFKQMLNALSDVLKKAEAHATEKNIDPNAFLQARLYPDMFPLVRQVQIAVDFAKGVSSRLAEVEVPKYDDTETTFAELQALLPRFWLTSARSSRSRSTARKASKSSRVQAPLKRSASAARHTC
jgi:hypothetical protein